ncbi:orotidine-5'-phosphate decarboxylase [candidate division KSB1 bacterium]
MTKKELTDLILKKKSFLCVGLDSDIQKIPKHLLEYEDPIFEFNKRIIDATLDYTVAYKPNIAFYESRGVKGWQSLQKTIDYLNGLNEEVFTIADAKRGDIGNTSKLYARAFFEPESSGLDFDAITAAPYMGSDSIEPFLEYKNKWVILLVLTSNKGYKDLQTWQPINFDLFSKLGIKLKQDKMLFELVIKKSQEWGGSHNNMMFVVGATRSDYIKQIRKLAPYHFLLIPGVGRQGGSLHKVAKYGLNKSVGLLVNSSRSIIYAEEGDDFEQNARQKARGMQKQMKGLLMRYHLI